MAKSTFLMTPYDSSLEVFVFLRDYYNKERNKDPYLSTVIGQGLTGYWNFKIWNNNIEKITYCLVRVSVVILWHLKYYHRYEWLPSKPWLQYLFCQVQAMLLHNDIDPEVKKFLLLNSHWIYVESISNHYDK